MITARKWGSGVALVLLATLLGCTSGAAGGKHGGRHASHSGSFPVTVDAANGKVRLDRRPTAVISLSPTATEMLYAIGAGSQVKAVDDDSNYPPKAPRTKLSGLEPNLEAIASYHPDLVIISYNPDSLMAELAKLHIPVLYEPAASSLSQDYGEFRQIGEATGRLAAADREVAGIKRQIAAIVKSVKVTKRPESYYYEIGEAPYYSVTSSTFVGQLLSLLGLKSVADSAKGAAASGGYPELSAEFIVHSNPDYIFLADTICCHQSAATVAARPGWSVMSAVKDHRILGLNDNIASRWGPRIVVLLRDVANELKSHPVSR